VDRLPNRNRGFFFGTSVLYWSCFSLHIYYLSVIYHGGAVSLLTTHTDNFSRRKVYDVIGVGTNGKGLQEEENEDDGYDDGDDE
jgi:hypothetical protein